MKEIRKCPVSLGLSLKIRLTFTHLNYLKTLSVQGDLTVKGKIRKQK